MKGVEVKQKRAVKPTWKAEEKIGFWLSQRERVMFRFFGKQRLEKRVKEIEEEIKKSKKSQEVTQDTLDLEFTI